MGRRSVISKWKVSAPRGFGPVTLHRGWLLRWRWLGAIALLVPLLAGCSAVVNEDASAGVLLVSTGANHAGAQPLADQTLAGTVYVYVPPAPGLQQVSLYLDDASKSGAPVAVLDGPFALTLDSTVAGAWNTAGVADGRHTLTAVLTYIGASGAGPSTVTASFNVFNGPAAGEAGPGPAPSGNRLFGAWVPPGPWSGMGPYTTLEKQLGYQLGIVHWYEAFSDPWVPSMVDAASQNGRLPMITWEPHSESLASIAAGSYDGILRTWARGAAAHHGPVYLRPFQEMNTNFFPWGMQPTEFVLAWRHIVDVFRAYGATNVRFVWSPNLDDNPATVTNKMENYYPGAAYVDVLAIDGYNWGTCKSWSKWTSFDDLFASAYKRVAALGNQPIWIAEFGSTELGGDKAQWVRNAFASTSFPRIRALVYFDEDNANTCDWRINSSTASLQAFVDALKTFH